LAAQIPQRLSFRGLVKRHKTSPSF